ncbi:hypothetical protein ACP0HM_12330 [Escherichia coli]
MYIIMSFTGKKLPPSKRRLSKHLIGCVTGLMEMAHSYQREHNELMLEFMKEKGCCQYVRTLAEPLGQDQKPQLIARIERLEQQAQISIPGLPK